MKTLLKEGDVIFLENGMMVYASIPEMFIFENKKKSRKLIKHKIIIGKNFVNNTDITEDVKNLAKQIVEAFSICLGYSLSKVDALNFIESKVNPPKSISFCLEEGEFVVTKTNSDGGGIAMFHDEYPDGHHVFCKKLKDSNFDENGIEVDFYQTGSFTAMISPKKLSLLRTMSRNFV
jgi:hypothetical protein